MLVVVRISFERFVIDMEGTHKACYSLAAGVVQTANIIENPSIYWGFFM